MGMTGREVSRKSFDLRGCGFLVLWGDVRIGDVGVDAVLSEATRASSIIEISFPAPDLNSGFSLSLSDLTEASSISVELFDLLIVVFNVGLYSSTGGGWEVGNGGGRTVVSDLTKDKRAHGMR